MENRKVLISILNYNGSQDTISCVKSFYEYEDEKEYSIVIWDNCSVPEQQEELKTGILELGMKTKICTDKEYPEAKLKDYDIILSFSKKNLGFAKGNNQVIREQIDKFDYIILLNNDTFFEENTTKKLIDYLHNHHSTGIVTSSIYYYYHKNSIWNAGGKMFFGTRKYYTNTYVDKKLKMGITEQNVDYITGCYLVVKSSIFKKYGLLTEKYFFGEEDYEFCKRMKKNKVKLTVLFDKKIYHKVGASIQGKNISITSTVRSSFVHHLNRFIDMKDDYPLLYWNCWRVFSSLYIVGMMLKITKRNWYLITKYIVLLNYYAIRKNEVGKGFFLAVLNGKII